MSVRWTAQDPATGATYVFPVNPRKMTTPLPTLAAQDSASAPGWGIGETLNQGPRTKAVGSDPVQWQFDGFIHDAAMLTSLQNLFKIKARFYLTDHLGRTFSVRIVTVDVDELVPSARAPYRYAYSANAMVYAYLNPPALGLPTV